MAKRKKIDFCLTDQFYEDCGGVDNDEYWFYELAKTPKGTILKGEHIKLEGYHRNSVKIHFQGQDRWVSDGHWRLPYPLEIVKGRLKNG